MRPQRNRTTLRLHLQRENPPLQYTPLSSKSKSKSKKGVMEVEMIVVLRI
jgi:hypothetical protein